MSPIEHVDGFSLDRQTTLTLSNVQVRLALNLAYLISDGSIISKPLDNSEKEVHLYDSVVFNSSFVPENSTRFFPTLHAVDKDVSISKWSLKIDGATVEMLEIPTLYMDKIHEKNRQWCSDMGGIDK